MKRYGNLYKKICTKENLIMAHKMARKDKGLYSAVKDVDENLEERIQQIQDMLINKTYQVGNYNIGIIEDKGKKRILHKLPYFPDRIIQWAILLQTEKIFLSAFTNFTCASLKDRGIHYASNLVTKWMNEDHEGTQYCLKIDMKKFYPSINRTIMKNLLRKKFKDTDLLWLLDKIIDSMDNTDIQNLNIPDEFKKLYSHPDKGIPIGSYLSQFLGNFYLTYFDHWLKEDMKCKYVVRYMDDVVIFDSSKERLHSLIYSIQKYLITNLDMEVKGNWQVFPTEVRGIDFVGYRHFYGYKLLRKTTYKRCKKKMLQIKYCIDNDIEMEYSDWCSYMSYMGWLTWCNSYNFFLKYCKDNIPQMNNYYKRKIKTKEKDKNKEIINITIYEKNCTKHKIYYNPTELNRKRIHKQKGEIK